MFTIIYNLNNLFVSLLQLESLQCGQQLLVGEKNALKDYINFVIPDKEDVNVVFYPLMGNV